MPLIVTCGTGKNGTHAIAEMGDRAVPDRVMISIHEPRPCLDSLECMLYEGRVDERRVRQSYLWEQWSTVVAGRAQTVHVANNHLTLLVPCLRREFDVRMILPIRSWRPCVRSLLEHGVYSRERLFIHPRDPALRLRWSALPDAAKVAWMWRTKNELGRRIAAGMGSSAMVIETERLTEEVDNLLDFFAVKTFSRSRASGAVKARPGTGDRHEWSDIAIDAAMPDISAVFAGEFDDDLDAIEASL